MTVHDLNARRISPELRSWQATLDVHQGRAKYLRREDLPSDDELRRVHRELGELVRGKR